MPKPSNTFELPPMLEPSPNSERLTPFGGHSYFQHTSQQAWPKIQVASSSHKQKQLPRQQYHSQFSLPKIYVSSFHHSNQPLIDPASELLERKRRNASASARFRNRKKQREKLMQEKCQSLEMRVQELEGMDSVKRIIELEKKLMEVNNEREKLEVEVTI